MPEPGWSTAVYSLMLEPKQTWHFHDLARHASMLAGAPLDELLRSLKSARKRLIDLESCSDEEIEPIERQFRAFRAREERKRANGDTTST